MPRKRRSGDRVPAAIHDAVRTLGANIAQARLRRRLRQEDLARRAGISRGTVVAVERGETGTSIQAYAACLWALGLLEELGLLASTQVDEEGMGLLDARLGERARSTRGIADDF